MRLLPIWTYLRRRAALKNCVELDVAISALLRQFPRALALYVSERDLKKLRDDLKRLRGNVDKVRAENLKGRLFSAEHLQDRLGEATLKLRELMDRDQEWSCQLEELQRSCRELQKRSQHFHPKMRDKVGSYASRAYSTARNALDARTVPQMRIFVQQVESHVQEIKTLVATADEATIAVAGLSVVGESAAAGKKIDPELSQAAFEHIKQGELELSSGNYNLANFHFRAAKSLVHELGDRDKKRRDIIVSTLKRLAQVSVAIDRADGTGSHHDVSGRSLHPKLLDQFEQEIRALLSSGASSDFWEAWDRFRPRFISYCDDVSSAHNRDFQKFLQHRTRRTNVMLRWRRDLDWREVERFARAVQKL